MGYWRIAAEFSKSRLIVCAAWIIPSCASTVCISRRIAIRLSAPRTKRLAALADRQVEEGSMEDGSANFIGPLFADAATPLRNEQAAFPSLVNANARVGGNRALCATDSVAQLPPFGTQIREILQNRGHTLGLTDT